jgi:hypothetical protein
MALGAQGGPGGLEPRAEHALQAVVLGPEGQPLVGAFVVLVPESVPQANLERQTDSQGRANFAAADGRYRLLAFWQAKNQFARYVWLDLEVASSPAVPRVELRFPPLPSGTISGQVLSADGVPAAGAKVEAVERFSSLPLDGDLLRNTAYPRESASTRADAEGRFTLRNLREGEYVVSLEHKLGYGEVLARAGAPSAEMKLRSSRCAKKATGRVVDERGVPVRDFEVGPEHFKDPRGRFTIKGACAIYIRAKGFLQRYVPLPRPVPERLELGDIVLERGRLLSGHVERSDGKPVVGLSLAVGSLEARTDKSGRFAVGPVSATGDVLVKLEEEGNLLLQRARPGEQGELTVRLPPGGSRLEVHVLGGEGRSMTPMQVTAEGTWGLLSRLTDSSGHALLSVPPGRHEVRITKKPGRSSERTQVVPLRFPATTVQVPEQGTLRLELSPARGAGRLRVLLPRPTHYPDVHVVPGAQPWPTDQDSWLRVLQHALAADAKADIWAQSELPLIYYEVLNDFSELVPGPYTVFVTNSYGGEEGIPLFRQVIEVTGSGRQVVQVRFEGDNTRVLHW